MSLTWFRLYGETVDDGKLKLLAFEDRWHFIAVLCCKAQGILDNTKPALLDRTIAAKLGLDLRALDEVKRRLIEVDLISARWQPTGWERRQYVSDDSTARVRKFRERQKTLLDSDPETDSEADTEGVVTGNVNVTLHETLPSDEWKEWIEHRKRRRWPSDPTTLRKQLKLLAKHDTATQRAMLDNSMQAGWQGLFEPKGNGKAAPPPQARANHASAARGRRGQPAAASESPRPRRAQGDAVNEDLDAKLARLNARVKDRAADGKARLDHMGFGEAARALRDTFGARLRFLSDRDGTAGSSVIDGDDLMRPGCAWTVYTPPKTRN
jgi:hypothetical protein